MTTFQKIIDNLTSEDLAVIRGFVLDTVRAEYGPLITSLQDAAMPADPWLDKGPEPTEVPTEAPRQSEFWVEIGNIRVRLA